MFANKNMFKKVFKWSKLKIKKFATKKKKKNILSNKMGCHPPSDFLMF